MSSRPLATLLLSALLLCGAAPAPAGQPQPPAPVAPVLQPQRVLVLLSTGYANPGVDRYASGLVRELAAQGVPRNRIHVEYLDLVRNGSPAYRATLAALLRQKYDGLGIDAVIVMQQAALNFLLAEGADLAPRARVLSAYTYMPPLLEQSGRSVLFQMPRLDYAGTLQRALELFPATRRVVVVTGNSELELARLADIRQQLAPWRDKLHIELTHERALAAVRQQLSTAPPDTVVLALGYSQDVTGNSYVPLETIEQLAAVSKAPVFVFNETTIVPRVLGGMVAPVDQATARMAQAALSAAPRLPLSQMQTDIVPMFDWAEIERWHIDPSVLPAATVFRNRPATLWSQYQPYVLASSLTILLLSAMLAALLWEIRRRRAVERTLAASEERHRGLIENAPEAILVMDVEQRRIVDANLSAQRLLGASRAELLGGGLQRYYAPVQPDGRPVADSVAEHIAQASAGQAVMCERTLLTRGGAVAHCELRLVDCSHGGRRLLRASFIDVTERKRQDQLTRQLLAEKQTILRNAQVGIAHIRGRRFLSSNQRLEELLGYAPGELDGQATELLYPSRQACAEAGERIYSVLGRGQLFSDELELMRKDGGTFWCLVSGSAIDPDWPQDGSIWIFTDVSARHAAAEQLQQHHDQLEALVAQRTRELEAARDQAEAASRAKSTFLANMSHELRTPLNAVIGFAQLMARDESLNEQQRGNVAIIGRAGSQLLELINEILALSRIQAGQQHLAAAPLDPAAMLREMASLLGSRARDAGGELVLELSGLPRSVRTDGGKLRQVLINLAGNAIKFAPHGMVRLTARGRMLRNGRAAIRFAVSDNGPGIAAADQHRIFEPFVQLPAGSGAAGTGLGLTIARQYLQLLGCELELQSSLGAGATFSFTLEVEVPQQARRAHDAPAAHGAAPDHAPPPPQALQPGRCVLVADDSADARLLLRQLLEPLGMTVSEARNGLEALELAAALQPELVFMDWRMPGMDGLQSTLRIRGLDGLRQPHIVMLTATAFEEQECEALQAGADQFLRKPLDQGLLYAALERAPLRPLSLPN